MKLENAEKLASRLIKQHHEDLKFGFCNGKWRVGYFKLSENRIYISRQFVQKSDYKTVKQVLLHEIAHATTIGHGHDDMFRQRCMELGCSANKSFLS